MQRTVFGATSLKRTSCCAKLWAFRPQEAIFIITTPQESQACKQEAAHLDRAIRLRALEKMKLQASKQATPHLDTALTDSLAKACAVTNLQAGDASFRRSRRPSHNLGNL